MSCEGCRSRKNYHETFNPIEIDRLIQNKGKMPGKKDAVAILSFLKEGRKHYFIAYKLKSVSDLLSRKDIQNVRTLWNK